jgi:hypothetical protein
MGACLLWPPIVSLGLTLFGHEACNRKQNSPMLGARGHGLSRFTSAIDALLSPINIASAGH